MNRKGFTLMELLLVVAVLAIVAAAAAPTFFGGAKEAMEEAKKASFMSAYQNTLSGANVYVSLQSSKGVSVNDIANAMNTDSTLEPYCPAASRRFDLGDSLNGTLTAKMNTSSNAVEVYYGTKLINLNSLTSQNKELDYTNIRSLLTSN